MVTEHKKKKRITYKEIMDRLDGIHEELGNAKERDVEMRYMTISAVAITLIISALANRIMLLTVSNVSEGVIWATHIMVIAGAISGGISWLQWWRFNRSRKANKTH